MNAVTQDSNAANAPKATRERQFGRTYDHEKGTVTITSAFDPNYKHVIDVAQIPEAVLRGFALMGVADYAVNEANDALKDERNGDETARRAAAVAAMAEASAEMAEGKIDFRSGVGLGGMRSAIGALGQALFELGKTYVLNQRGEKLEFNDLHSARNAAKSLYLDTTPKGPFKGKVDDAGQPVYHKGTKDQIMQPVNKDSNLTGRMIFNAIQEVDEVKAKLAEIVKTKPKATIAVSFG